MPPLHLDRVRKRYGRRGRQVLALDDLTLTVEDGEFMVLVGPSGCGKTTTLRLIAGLEDPEGGSIRAGSRDLRGVRPEHRDVAMVFQTGALYPHLSVAGNIGFPLEMRGVSTAERRQRVAATAALLEIDGLLDRRPHELSGGERQRVAIGRAIVREPAVLLLDEPFSSLDPPLRMRLRRELRSLHASRPRTSVHVTHDQEEALALGHRVAVIGEGRLHQLGTPEEIHAAPADAFVASFVGMPPMNLIEGRVRRASSGAAVFVAPDGIELPLPMQTLDRLEGGSLAEQAATLGIRPTELEIIAATGGAGAASPGLLGEATQCEPLGDRADVTIRLSSGVSLVARVPAAERPAVGTAVRLRASKIHLFESGPAGRAIAHLVVPSPKAST